MSEVRVGHLVEHGRHLVAEGLDAHAQDGVALGGAVVVGALADPLEVAARADPVAAVHRRVETGEGLHHLGGEVEGVGLLLGGLGGPDRGEVVEHHDVAVDLEVVGGVPQRRRADGEPGGDVLVETGLGHAHARHVDHRPAVGGERRQLHEDR